MLIVVFFQSRRPPLSNLTDTLFPYPTLFRSAAAGVLVAIEVETPRHRALAAKPDGCPFRQLEQRQIAVAVVVGDAEHALRSGLQLGLVGRCVAVAVESPDKKHGGCRVSPD